MESASLPAGTNIYLTPTKNLSVPAIVLRPDEPWLEPSSFCRDLERYAAICVVQSATPNDGIPLLRELTLAIIGALVPPWDWSNVGAPVIDESTGTAFLAARVRLSYKNGGN